MANNPKKTKDPTEVALSAIQDALDMREGDRPADRRDTVRPPPEDDLFMDPAGGAPDRAEPETVARDSIVSVGQAIRREVAAMGDGVERALARAAELESLVNNEVTALERAYNDNELRIRTLLDSLAQQRETLVGQAEQVRNAITNVHLDLSHDITSVSEAVA